MCHLQKHTVLNFLFAYFKDAVHHEYDVKISMPEFNRKNDELDLRIVIPAAQTNTFRFSAFEDGNVNLVSLKLKQKVWLF